MRFGIIRQSQKMSSEPLPLSSRRDSTAIERISHTRPAVPMLSPTNHPKLRIFSERSPWPLAAVRCASPTEPEQYGGSVITASTQPSGIVRITSRQSPRMSLSTKLPPNNSLEHNTPCPLQFGSGLASVMASNCIVIIGLSAACGSSLRSANDRHIRSRQGGAGLHLPATMRIFVERLRSRRHRAFGFGCLCSSRVADFAGTLGRRICRSSISPNKALQIIRSAPLGSDILDSLNLAPCSHARILIYRSYLNFLVRPLEKV